ncbi:MAG: hypothetical protein ACOCX4_02660, partial [Planctomycetota bacterium]
MKSRVPPRPNTRPPAFSARARIAWLTAACVLVLAGWAGSCPAGDAPATAEATGQDPAGARRDRYVRDFSDQDPLRSAWTTDTGALRIQPSGDRTHGDVLRVPVRFPDTTELWINRNVALARLRPVEEGPSLAFRRIAYSVFVPASATGRIQAALLLKDKDGLFFTAVCPRPLKAGEWNRVEADLSDGSLDVTPHGHGGRWSQYRITTIERIGFAFWSDQPFPDAVSEAERH